MKLWNRVNTEEKQGKSIKMAGKRVLGFIRRHKVLTIVLILFLCALIVFGVIYRGKKNTPQKEQSRTIETAVVEKMDLANSISVTGTIASAQTKTGTTTLNNLKVTEVCVEVGDTVQEGDVICRFDSEDIKEALATARNNYSVNQQIDALGNDYQTQYEESVEQAEDTLQSARSKRDEAKSAYQSAIDAESAAKAAYEKAQAAIAPAKNAYDNALEEVKEAVVVYDQVIDAASTLTVEDIHDLEGYLNNITDKNTTEYTSYLSDKAEVYQTAKAAYEKAQSEATSARSAYQSAQSAASQAYSAYEQAQSAREDAQEVYEDSLEKAEETYEKAKLSDQLISENDEKKQIEEYEEQLSDCTVYAAMDGVITSLSVEEGENFSGGSIYEIQDLSSFVVKATVDEYDIVDLAKGMVAYVKTDSMGDEEMEAEVTYVAPVGTSGTQMGSASGTASYEIEITILEPQERLRAGMTAKVSISLEESRDALAVPYDCVQTNANGESVVYADIDGRRTEIVVETGIETDYYTEIISDELEEGMNVYLSTQMIQSSGSGEEENTEEGMLNFNLGGGMRSDGGARPDGGARSGGGAPSGGAPSGGPGGF